LELVPQADLGGVGERADACARMVRAWPDQARGLIMLQLSCKAPTLPYLYVLKNLKSVAQYQSAGIQDVAVLKF
jgi:hypothetical protein